MGSRSVHFLHTQSIGFLEPEWNHFDKLADQTKLIHNTKRKTQPWKTGLPVDYTVRERRLGFIPTRWIKAAQGRLLGEAFSGGRYKPHPDPNQERFFFGLLRECIDKGVISEQLLREEMAKNHIRHDALELLNRSPALAA